MPGTVDNQSIYSLKVLIPFWVLQLINVILLLAFAALELQFEISLYNFQYCYTSTYDGQEYCSTYYDDSTAVSLGIATGAAGLAVGLSVIFLILHITQIALFGRKKLTPGANFGFELPRLILLLLDIILQAVGAAFNNYDYAVLPLSCILWLLYLGSLIYSSVIFHRYRRGRYATGGYNYGQHPSAYGQPQYHQGHFQQPYQQGSYHQGPYQQGPYQQSHMQQGYPQQGYPQQGQNLQGPHQPGLHQQGQYQAYAPQHAVYTSGQPMQQPLSQSHDASRQNPYIGQNAVPQMQQHNHQIVDHGQPDVSPIQPHSIPATASPPPQELKSSQ